MASKSCRHNRAWAVCGGYLLWCYECGAIRRMRRVEGNIFAALDKRWTKPTGPGGENPAMKEHDDGE